MSVEVAWVLRIILASSQSKFFCLLALTSANEIFTPAIYISRLSSEQFDSSIRLGKCFLVSRMHTIGKQG